VAADKIMEKPERSGPKPSNRQGEDTRRKIREAAYETLKVEGIKGASARAIARTGNFNQALIFYHFGGVNQLLVEAAKASSKVQSELYRESIEGVTELADLVAVAKRLHDRDADEGSVAVVTQLMAGAAYDQDMAKEIMTSFEPWIELVEIALTQAVGESPLAPMLPIKDMAYGISALFLGVELMSQLDSERLDEAKVFEMMGTVAGMLENVLATGSIFPAES